jgi:DNA-binding response OmpR family regulator
VKLLIIEDDSKILKALKIGLVNENFEVKTVSDGYEALDEINKFYDLAIIDIMLPNLSGLEITKKLKSINPKTKVIFLTSKHTLEDKLKGFEVGADDYITKPFSFQELVARIRANLKRDTENNQIKFKDILLDLNDNTVRIKDQDMEFSKREYELLKFLLINKNKVYSKEDLIEKVWGYDSEILTNTVEVFIKSIRDKLKKITGNEKIIQTQRGFGYVIKDD